VQRQQADRAANLDEDGVLKAWQQAYPLPDDTADNSRADVKMMYKYVFSSFQLHVHGLHDWHACLLWSEVGPALDSDGRFGTCVHCWWNYASVILEGIKLLRYLGCLKVPCKGCLAHTACGLTL
jgi:hypothetical protein